MNGAHPECVCGKRFGSFGELLSHECEEDEEEEDDE